MSSPLRATFVGLVLFIAACGGGGADTVKPTVTLAASSTNVTAPGNITLTATASDNVGVTRVEFYDGATKIGEDTTAPYTRDVALTAADNGSKTYTARAFDAAGNNETSSPVTVTVNIPVPDTEPPTILSVTPANNATGVLKNVNIVITFSERMNQAATQAAYQSSTNGIRPADVTFSWNTEGTVLTINPNVDLDYATGTNTSVVALTYTFTVTNTATDIAGNQLASQTFSFKTMRDITQTLNATSISGWVRSDGVVNDLTTCSPMCVGDSGTAANATYRGFLTFDLSGLAPNLDANNIISATLRAYQVFTNGSPYTDLEDCSGAPIVFCSDLLAQHVNYGPSLQDSDFDTNTLRGLAIAGCSFISGCPSTDGYKEANALEAVKEDWANRSSRGNRSQYRLRFARNTDADGLSDIAAFSNAGVATNQNQLVVRYLVP